MKTGIILEIDEKYLTLLTPEGQFLRARNLHYPYQIGQEIQFIPFEAPIRQPLKWYSTVKGKTLAAALAIMIGASTFIPYFQSNQVYAYMTIDDGSSIEMEVNEELEVIGIMPYNDEGEKIVKELGDWKKQSFSAVSEKIITEMEKQKVGDGAIVISSTIHAKETNKETQQKLKEELAEIKTVVIEHKATVTHVKGTEEERKKAMEQGVTVGQVKKEEMAENAKDKQENQKLDKEQSKQNKMNPANDNVSTNHPNSQEGTQNNNVDQNASNKQILDKQIQQQVPQQNGNKNQQKNETKQNKAVQNNVKEMKQENPNGKGNQK